MHKCGFSIAFVPGVHQIPVYSMEKANNGTNIRGEGGGMGLTIKVRCRWLLSVGALDVSSVLYEIVFTGSTTKELKWWTNTFRDNGLNNWQIGKFK